MIESLSRVRNSGGRLICLAGSQSPDAAGQGDRCRRIGEAHARGRGWRDRPNPRFQAGRVYINPEAKAWPWRDKVQPLIQKAGSWVSDIHCVAIRRRIACWNRHRAFYRTKRPAQPKFDRTGF
jgi:hypothetical protein